MFTIHDSAGGFPITSIMLPRAAARERFHAFEHGEIYANDLIKKPTGAGFMGKRWNRIEALSIAIIDEPRLPSPAAPKLNASLLNTYVVITLACWSVWGILDKRALKNSSHVGVLARMYLMAVWQAPIVFL